VTGRQADLKGLQTPECLRFLIEREEDGIRGRANRRPAECAEECMRGFIGAWIIIDIQLWPASDGLNVDVHGTSRFVVLFHGRRWWEVF
jgi:hypothetical protein